MNKQQGFAHQVLIIGLMVTIIGALGFIFWQNFIYKAPETKTVTVKKTTITKSTDQTSEDKTYTNKILGISFNYPGNWTVNDKDVKQEEQGYTIANIEVLNETGESEAWFSTGYSLGGVCGEDAEQTQTLYSEDTSIGTKPANFSLTALKVSSTKYIVHYGLTDLYSKSTETGACEGVFYYGFETGEKNWPSASFANSVAGTKSFTSLAEIQEFIKSEEFQKIKMMITSLKY